MGQEATALVIWTVLIATYFGGMAAVINIDTPDSSLSQF